MRFGEVPVAEAEGAILAHSVRHGGVSFKKGRLLSVADIATLGKAGVTAVHVARLSAEDMHEDEAAGVLARAVSGDNLVLQEASTGRCNIYAGAAGVLLVDAGLVRAINRLDEAITLATLTPFQAVEHDQMVATVKIIPFAAPRHVVEEAANRLSGTGH